MTRAERIADDYDTLCRGVGALWLDRDFVAVRGADALAYLQGQSSQDLGGLVDGAGTDSLLLSPQGKIDALVRIARLGAESFVLDVDGGYGDAVVERLERFRLRVKVEILGLPWRCAAIRASDAQHLADRPGGDPLPSPTMLELPFAWGGLVGVDLLGPSPEIPGGIPEVATEAWEIRRIEVGVPHMGAEIDDRTIAAEAGLVKRCISFTKGCFTGQELVARLDARGNKVSRRLCGVVLDGGWADADVVRGADVVVEGKSVGRVTSAAWSPGTHGVVALAYLHRSVAVPSRVELAPAGRGPDPSTDAVFTGEARLLPLA
jgi:tRNA-modifying protein YgfZ